MAVAIAINIAVGSLTVAAAPADLPGLDRDGPRRRARRAVGRRPDRPAGQPHLVAPADPRRRRAGDRVLRAGRRRHRPDGRLLGEPRRLPACAPTTRASAGSSPSPRDRGGARSRCWSSRRRSVSACRPGRTLTRSRPRSLSSRLADRRSSASSSAWLTGRTSSGSRAGRPARSGVPASARPRSGGASRLRGAPAAVRARPATSRRVDGVPDDGTPDPLFGGADLTGLALAGSRRADRRDRRSACLVGVLVYVGASRRARPAVPGLGRRVHDRPRRGGDLRADRGRRVRRRDRRRHGPARRAVPDARPRRVPVGLRPGPDQRPARQDDQLHGRVR